MNQKIDLELKNVSKCYGTTECRVTALDNVSLKIYDKDFVSIVGPSGSGKSTMLHMLGLLDQPSEGEVLIDNINTSDMSENRKADLRKKKIGFIFQMFNLIPSLTAVENVEIPQVLLGRSKEERRKKSIELLEKLGMGARIDHFPNQMSGGEKQRVAIARALSNDPEIILADEPTGNLDSKRGAEILEILKKLNKEGKTIIMITHDNNIAAQSKHVIKLKDGKIISDK